MAKTSKVDIHFKSPLQALPGTGRVVTVDVETTGLSAQRGGRVIEVGAVALENGVWDFPASAGVNRWITPIQTL